MQIVCCCCVRADCGITIEKKATITGGPSYLNLREVMLFDRTGAQIPIQFLTATLSTTLVFPQFRAELCIDGCIDGCIDSGICHTGIGDTDPKLTIVFPCVLGLSRVSVYNRLGYTERIMDFQMRFWGTGIETTPAYGFNTNKEVYDVITVLPSEWKGGVVTVELVQDCNLFACVARTVTYLLITYYSVRRVT